jgi:hypothetical protein
MSTASVGPFNLVNGASVNPMARGSWVPGQVKYLVVYNTSQYPIVVNTINGPQQVQAFQAEAVETNGGNVTIAPAPLIGYNNSANYPVYLGICGVTLYDEAESYPQGFPVALSSGGAGYQVTNNETSNTSVVYIPSGYPAITVINNGPSEVIVTATGATTGKSYFTGYVPGGTTAEFLVNGPDGSIILTQTGTNPLSVYAYPGPTPVYTVNVANPAAGSNWSYTLLAPARLVGVTATFASSSAANRFARLAISGLNMNTSLTSAVITTNSLIVFTAYPGAPFLQVNDIPVGEVQQLAPLSNLMLSAGYVIQGIMDGIVATDQWEGITLTFSAE